MAAIVCLGDIDPIRRRLVNGCPNPEPRPYMHLRGMVGLCSCVWFLLLCFYGVGVLTAAGGVLPMPGSRALQVEGGDALEVQSPLGGATSSGRKFPVARALLRLSKFGHRTLSCLSNA